MATNWKIAADQDSVDQVSAKIGESTDNESKATVLGKMWGIRNVVDWIKTTWTAERASFLDVAISSRAAASTALSTATWTAARAGKLDNLDTKASVVNATAEAARVAAVNAQNTAGRGTVKGVQRGITNLANLSSIPISAVNTNKAVLEIYPYVIMPSESVQVRNEMAVAGILNTNSILIYKVGQYTGGNYNAIWQVVEYN